MYLKVSVAINGNELQSYVFDQKEVLIGRDAGCHVRLDNAGVSRNHAKLVVEGETIEVVDLGSGNGTFVNGEQVTQVSISAKDALRIGKFTLRSSLISEGAPLPAGHAVDAGVEPDAADSNTVFLRPDETRKILQQAQAASAPPKPSPVGRSSGARNSQGYIFAAGALVGLFLGWLFWY